MGPRLFGRGKLASRRRTRCQPMLQWGPVCSDGESAAQLGHTSEALLHASMGPRLFGRGKVLGGEDVGEEVVASMGPRLFGRGKGLTVGHMPINLLLQWGPVCSDGESPTRTLPPPRIHLASMGPRLFGRGKKRPGQEKQRALSLQWGPVCSDGERRDLGKRSNARYRFNGAPSVRTGKAPHSKGGRSSPRASMGPRLFGRGKLNTAFGGPVGQGASMGPRLFGRGKTQECRNTRRWGEGASMGPRLFGRGKRLQLFHTSLGNARFNGAPSVRTGKGVTWWGRPRCDRLLQWGPVCSDGERLLTQCETKRTELLQWGPVCSDGERNVAPVSPRSSNSFNGAPSVRTGKASPRLHLHRRRHHASMGPRLFGRGKRRDNMEPNFHLASFNGAPSVRTGKAQVQTPARDRQGASMGPRLFGRGKEPFDARARGPRTSFNGAPSVRTGKGGSARPSRTTTT